MVEAGSAEDNCLVLVGKYLAFDVLGHSKREDNFLQVTPLAHQAIWRIFMGDACHILLDDRAGIQLCRDIVARSTYNLHAARPRLMDQGYIYFNESEVADNVQTVGKLVKIKPDGTKASEIALGTSLRSSPTISPDGTIYCTGMKDGRVTLFSVKGSATGAAPGWSQFGGNSRKTCKAE